MEDKFSRLDELSDKLKKLSVIIDRNMTQLSGMQQVGYELQYDLFMEFIGLYEDTKKEVSFISNDLDRRRLEKQLDALWSKHDN